ncbi:MAG: carboxypeptidase-like regulatory domain-containing protein [Sphingomonas sp.]|nr:carboxypeptidase-like regulatory domain-containing protein [Sphingomonas sp.]
MRIFLLMLATLLLAAPAHAQSHDNDKDFDSLFGAQPARVSGSRTPRAGRDDLSIVALYLGRFQLLESLPAYMTSAGLCLPLGLVLDAMEIAHSEANGQQVIDLHAPERRVSVDPVVLTPSPEGSCMALAAFAKFLPVTLRYDEANLRITIDSAEPLPVAARLDRAERRRQALSGAEPARPNFPRIANPWGAVGWPTLDMALAFGSGSNGNSIAGQVEMVADLAGMTARARLAAESSGPPSVRLALGRDSEASDQLGPLHARSFAIGDVNVPAQPLIGVASSGRGIVISNRPQWRADLFDQIELRGPLPRGWDAELHRDDRLVAVCEKPDAAGDYVFADVPLRAGANNYIVRLFGPHGEIEERAFTRFVGNELNTENEFVYSVGIVDSGLPIFGPPVPTQTAIGSFAFAALEHGIAGGVSMRVDMRAPLTGGSPAMAAGVHAAMFGGFGSLLVAGDGGGRPAVALRGVRQWGSTNIKFEATDYGDITRPPRPGAVNGLAREFGFSAATRLGLGRRSLPLLVGWRRIIERSGSAVDRLDSSLALAMGEWRFSQGASLERRDGTAPTLLGNIAVARAIGGWRLRGGLDFGVADGFSLHQIGASAARATARGSMGIDFGWDARRGAASVAATAERHFGAISVGGGVGIGPNGWRVGLNLSAALFHDSRVGYRFAVAGIGHSGALQPHVFEDIDGDGAQGAGEPDIGGASFIVDSSIRRETTATDGTARIGGLLPGSRVDMEVQLASLPDLRLRPVHPGVSAVVRPGQVLDVPVPLRQTGEIEALVETINGDLHRPLPGIEVALVDTSGKRVAVTRSDFEGLAYFDGVPQGNWRLEAAHAVPVKATLRQDALLVTGLRLLIVQ